MKILDHPYFDLKDFSDRWERARVAALRSAFGTSESQDLDLTEYQLMKFIDDKDQEDVLRKVFDYSRKFGMSLSRYLGMSFELSDLVDVLETLSIPCFHGKWRMNNKARVLERAGCRSLSVLGSISCDYWREALDGLVMGVGENERLARHRSLGHGDDQCIDVLFTEDFLVPRVISADSRKELSAKELKFGPLPDDVKDGLKDVCDRFGLMKVQLHLEGVSEGILYYQLKTQDGVLCGAGGKLMHDSFHQEVFQRFPRLMARDIGPLAVYGGAS